MDSSGLPIPIGGSKPLSAVLLELSSRGLRLSSFPAPPQAKDALFTSSGIIDPGDAPSSSHLYVPDFSSSEFWPNQGIDMGLVSHERQNLDTNTDHYPVSSNAGLSDLVQKFEIHGSYGNTLFTEEQQLHGQQLQVATTSREQPGQSLTSNAQFNQQNFQLLLSSAESFMDQGTKKQNDPKQLSASTKKPTASTQIKIVENQGSLGVRPQHSNQPGSSQCHQQGKHHDHQTFPLSPLSPAAAPSHMNFLNRMESLKLSFMTQSLLDNERRCGKQPAEEKQVAGKVHPEESGVNTAYKPGRGAECLNQYMFLKPECAASAELRRRHDSQVRELSES